MALAGEAAGRMEQPPCFAGEGGALLEGIFLSPRTTFKKLKCRCSWAEDRPVLLELVCAGMEKSQGWDPGGSPREQEHPDIILAAPSRLVCPFQPFGGIHHPPQAGKASCPHCTSINSQV